MSLATGLARVKKRGIQALNEFKQEIRKEGGVSGDYILSGYIETEARRIVDRMTWDDDCRHEYVDEMITDSTIESVTNVVELPLKQAGVFIEPASQDRLDLEIADKVDNDLLNNPNFTWHEVLNDSLTFLPYGFSILWKEFERVDRRWRWKRFALRRQSSIDRWDITTSGHLLRVHQQALGYDGEFVDQWLPEKPPRTSLEHPLMHFAYKQTGDNFMGRSLLRQCWRPYVMKRESYFNMATQIVHASSGLPHVEYQGNLPALNSPERNAVQEVMQRLQAGQQNFVESSKSAKIGVAGGKDLFGFDLTGYMYYFDQQIVASILATFLEQPKLQVGSRAMQQSNISFFLSALEAIANQNIESVWNNGFRGMQHIKQYVNLNYPQSQSSLFVYPKLRLTKIDQLNTSEFAKILTLFNNAGMPILPEDWNIARERLGFREVEIEELQEFMKEQRKQTTAIRSGSGYLAAAANKAAMAYHQ